MVGKYDPLIVSIYVQLIKNEDDNEDQKNRGFRFNLCLVNKKRKNVKEFSPGSGKFQSMFS